MIKVSHIPCLPFLVTISPTLSDPICLLHPPISSIMQILTDLIVDVCSTTGVPLDPDFCVKAVNGMLGEMKKNPERFAGRRVLYLHTGRQPLHTDEF